MFRIFNRENYCKKRKIRGFSFIEIVVTASIIAILATIALPIYTNYKIYSDSGAFANQLNIIKSAIQVYFFEKNDYPDSSTGVNPNGLDVFLPSQFSFAKAPKTGYTWSWDKPGRKIILNCTKNDYNDKLVQSISEHIKETLIESGGIYSYQINI